MSPNAAKVEVDVAIVGGGLAGQLCALALAVHAPALSVAIVDRAPAIGGNHTWCCHRSDLLTQGLLPSLPSWLASAIDARWPGYQVLFPKFERVLDGEYLCLRGASLTARTLSAMARPGCVVITGQSVDEMSSHQVRLSNGRTLRAHLVLDARGGELADHHGCAGYQKFIGCEIELPSAGASSLSVLMDATVEQTDGYRFVYTLPFSPTRILVEDTYFSRNKSFELNAARVRLRSHLAARGVASYVLVREEVGILPMPWGRPVDADPPGDHPIAIGYRGGFFHPATGYSLARSVLVAEQLGRLVASTQLRQLGQGFRGALARLRKSWSTDDRFGRLLNRLAFGLAPPSWLRDRIFAPVYRLPAPVLARFYAGRTRLRDRLAIAAAPARLPMFRQTAPSLPLLGERS